MDYVVPMSIIYVAANYSFSFAVFESTQHGADFPSDLVMGVVVLDFYVPVDLGALFFVLLPVFLSIKCPSEFPHGF